MARYDDPQFIIDQNLDPNQWHVVGTPAPKPDKNGIAPSLSGGTRTDSQGNKVNVPANSGRDQVDFTVTLIGPAGETRTVTMRPQGEGVNAANVGVDRLDWNVTGVEQGITPTQANATGVDPKVATQKAATEAAEAAQRLKDLQDDNNKRQSNLSSRGLFMTDKEIADMDKALRDQGLQQSQIDAQLKIASDNNANSRTSNEIAAVNAATSAQVAASNAKIAQARLELDGSTQADKHAQGIWMQESTAIDQTQRQGKLDLDRLTQQQANEISKAQVGATQQANVLRGQEGVETGRHNVATEAAQAAATAQQAAATQQTAVTAAQTAATQAATSTYGNELQAKTAAGTVGGSLLANRVTGANNLINNILSGIGGMSQGSAGRYRMHGGGLHAVPAGFSGADLVGGAYGYVGEQMGGQSTLDAAAAMVRNAAPGSEMTPMGQAAIGVLHQAFDRAAQLGGTIPNLGAAGPNGALNPAPTTQIATAGAPTTVGAGAGQQQQQVVIPQQQFVQSGLAEGRSVVMPQQFAQSGLSEGRGVQIPIQAPLTLATPTVLVA